MPLGLVGAEANRIEAKKRPLSSMSPTLVLKAGEPVLTLGAAGGPTIITQVVQGLINYLALDYDLNAAIARPRIHQQWKPPVLFAEETVAKAVKSDLQARGHMLKKLGSFGGTQAISLKDGKFTAVTEPRVIARNKAAKEQTHD